MLLEDIITLPAFSLPHIIPEKDDFEGAVGNLLDSYYATIERSAKMHESFTATDFNKYSFLEELNGIITAIKSSLKEYLHGFPAKAYKQFDEYLFSSDLFNYLVRNKQIYLKRSSPFYRIRADKSISPNPDPLNLFHIPFDMRRRVATQRYSIPGFPCLYLANSMEVAWREMDKPDINKIKAIAFQNLIKLKVIDMVPMDMVAWHNQKAVARLINDRKNTEQQLYYYALAWPLVAACHLKVHYIDKPAFKAEYIMPQLLLQWLVQFDPTVDGIRYFSSQAFFDKGNIDHYFNYVVPVKNIQATGYCTHLLNIFTKTPALNAAKIGLRAPTYKTDEERALLKLQQMQSRLLSSSFTTF